MPPSYSTINQAGRLLRLCIISSLLFLRLCLPGKAETAPDTIHNLDENFYETFVATNSTSPEKYTMGPGEIEFLNAFGDDWGILQRQPKFAGINDNLYEMLAYNPDPEDLGTYEPGIWFIAVHFPQNTGNKQADAGLKNYAKDRFQRMLDIDPEKIHTTNPLVWLASKKFGPDEDGFFDERPQFLNRAFVTKQLLTGVGIKKYSETVRENRWFSYPIISTYLVCRPSPRYISVMFTNWSYYGGAHDNWNSHVLSFDLQTGKQLELKDIMPDLEKSIPLLKDKLGRLAYEKKGIDYDSLLPAFQQLFDDPAEAELKMHKIALTPEGLVYIFDPYEIDCFAAGTIALPINKDELGELGIDLKFWQ